MNYEYIAKHLPHIAQVGGQLTRYIDRRTFAAIEANRAARTVKTRRELEKRVAAMRVVFSSSVGPLPYNPATPLNARVTGKIVEDGMTIEKVIFTSRPHIYVTANVYIPKGIETPAPAILFQPGHAANGKAFEQYQKVARTIAAHGLIVMLMDPPGQGERLNYFVEGEAAPRIGGSVPDHQQFGTLFYLAGRNPVACFLADAMRAIDYLISRSDVDPMRIGATGSSGGGTMTSVLAALDPRVAAAAPGTFLSTRDAITVGGQLQDIEQMWPGTLLDGFDHHELIACFCPKPYLILAVDADSFPLDGTQEIYDYGRECYRLAGKPDNLRLAVDRSTHRYTLPLARAAGRFFAEVFGIAPRNVSIEGVPALTDAELAATEKGQVLWSLPDAWPMWREAQEFLKNAYRPGVEVVARGLARRLHAYDDPPNVYNFRFYGEGDGGRIRHAVWLGGKNRPIFGALIRGEGDSQNQPVTVVVLPEGTADAVTYAAEIDALLAEGRTVLIANLSGRGNARAQGSMVDFKADSDLIFLGDSLCALLARDLIATCRVVAEECGVTPEILAVREAAVWARLAATELPGVTVRTCDEITLTSRFEDVYYDHSTAFTSRARGLAKYMK